MLEHDADGVLIEKLTDAAAATPPKRTRRVLSLEEKAERERIRAEREAKRAHELATFEAAFPALRVDGEPPVQAERPIRLDARTAAGEALAIVKRANGSELRIVAKTYDGFMGGAPKRYIHASIWFRGSGAYLVRSKGVGIEGIDEARAMRDALALWIAAREAEDALPQLATAAAQQDNAEGP